MLYALTHINKVVEALCLLLILSAKESMFRAKKRPIAESICNGDKKLPQYFKLGTRVVSCLEPTVRTCTDHSHLPVSLSYTYLHLERQLPEHHHTPPFSHAANLNIWGVAGTDEPLLKSQ